MAVAVRLVELLALTGLVVVLVIGAAIAVVLERILVTFAMLVKPMSWAVVMILRVAQHIVMLFIRILVGAADHVAESTWPTVKAPEDVEDDAICEEG